MEAVAASFVQAKVMRAKQHCRDFITTSNEFSSASLSSLKLVNFRICCQKLTTTVDIGEFYWT